jgi:phosphotransferase system  glucose/maltose/N-acetylglucosamine-specific IIC component
MFARFSTLLLAAILASPALYQAFVIGDLDIFTALVRYLIAILVAAVMIGLFRMLTRAYHEAHARRERDAELDRMRAEIEERRRANDRAEGPNAGGEAAGA